MKIGAQLYNLRAFCKTLPELSETLAKVADIGYRSVQLSGVCDYTPEWITEELRKNGLTADLTHYNAGRIANDTDAVIAEHKAFGCRYIGIGSMPNFKKNGCKPEDYQDFVESYRPAARAIRDAGCKFMYHNHNFEFAKLDGKLVLERLCEDFTPAEMGITLDTYWVQAGGADPVEWIKRLHGRLDCVHFKDMCYSATDLAVRMAPVGKGNMNFPAIIDACLNEGVKYAFIEQDHSYEEDPFDCLRQSFAYLRSLGLV